MAKQRADRQLLGDIVQRAKEAGSHYFDRDTLKFFGQRLSDFHAVKVGSREFVYGRQGKGFWHGESDIHAAGHAQLPWSVGKVREDGTILSISGQLPYGGKLMSIGEIRRWIRRWDEGPR